MLTQSRLKELLSYDPKTGIFIKKIRTANRVRVGDIAGSIDHKGYSIISLCGRRYKAHRLAWLYMYGVMPEIHIDHINGIRDDNRIINLRQATFLQNALNKRRQSNTVSGLKGVSFYKNTNKWVARATFMGKVKILGYFLTKEEASCAYQEFAKNNHGEFYCENQ